MPRTEKVKNLKLLPILMQIDNSRAFAFNFSNDFSIEDCEKEFNTSNPEHLYEFSKGIGLKNAEKYLFPCFL